MKKWTVIAIFGFLFSSIAGSAQDKQVLLTEISFKSVTASIDMTCNILFHDVSIGIPAEKLSIDVDKIEVKLDKSSGRNYTTLDILNPNRGYSPSDGYNFAEKVTVVVRSREDYKLWNAFLKKAKKKRDTHIKNSLQPVRVIPPEP